MNKTAINIGWFKRDLRFTDHEPLYYAQQQKLPLLLVYFLEPSVMPYYESDVRHWRFIYESLQEMEAKLVKINSKIFIFHNEVRFVFEALSKQYAINAIFLHQEIGSKITYDRDLDIQPFCKSNNTQRKEFQLQ